MSRLGKETGIKSQHWHLVSFCPFWPGGGLKPERSEGTATAKPGPQAPGPGAPGERGAQTRPHGPGPPLGGQGPRPQASGSERPGRGRARRRTSRAAGPERPGGPQGRPRRGAKKRASKPKPPGAERNYFARSDGERRERVGAKGPPRERRIRAVPALVALDLASYLIIGTLCHHF